MEIPTRDKRHMARILRNGRVYFALGVLEGIVRLYQLWGNLIPCLGVLEEYLNPEHDQAIYDKIRQPPTSVDDFAAHVGALFSSELLARFKARCDAFDKLCGSPIADAFMSQFTVERWALIIAENLLLRCDELKQQPHRWKSHWQGFLLCHEQDGPRKIPARPVTQIHLRGKTITEAWANDPIITRTLRAAPPKSWDPSSLLDKGEAELFYGEATHLRPPINKHRIPPWPKTEPTKLRFKRSFDPIQFHPNLAENSIPTSYSALRCFLWAAFMACVIGDPAGPASSTSDMLRQSFRSEREKYRGMLVVQFESSMPAPPGLTSSTISEGRELAWAQAARKCDAVHPRRFFGREVGHADVTARSHWPEDGFPDLIHGRELPVVFGAMRKFPCSERLLWRTAWVGEKGRDALNERATHVYAISFETEKTIAGLRDGDGGEGGGGENEKSGAFTRMFDYCLKKLF